MRILSFLVLILLGACSSKFNSNSIQFQQLILNENGKFTKFDTNYFHTQARKFLIAGTLKQQQYNYAASILEFQQALRYDSSAAIEYVIAKSYLQLGKSDLAKEHLFRSIELNPSFVQSYDLLTELYLMNYEYDKATITNSNAIDVEKTDKRLLTKALIKENTNPKLSLEIYDEINDPQYQDIINKRKIYIYKNLGEYDSLLSYLKDRQKLEPYNTELSREIFQLYLEQNQIDKAIDYMNVVDTLYYGEEQETYYLILATSLVRNKPVDTLNIKEFIGKMKGSLLFNEELMYYAGLLSSYIGNNIERDNFFKRVLKIAAENSDFRVGVAEAYFYDKEYKRSLDILDSIDSDSLRQKEYYYTLKGQNNYMLKRYEKTIANYNRVLALDSSYNNYITLTMLGEVYDIMGKLDSALYYYGIQYKLDSNNSYLLNNYAYTLSKAGKDLERALEMSAKTLDAFPDNSAFLDTYGWIKYQLGDYETALEYIEKAVNKGNVSAELYEHLGDTYMKLGKIEQAKENYKKSLEIDSDRFKLEDKLKVKTGK